MGDYDSRIERILQATIDGEIYTDPPQSRNEVLLIELNHKIAGTTLEDGDLDDITVTGFYSGEDCDNAPFDKFTLIVVGCGEGYASQICTDMATGAVKTRSDINGIWTAWMSLSGSALLIDSDDDLLATNDDDPLAAD